MYNIEGTVCDEIYIQSLVFWNYLNYESLLYSYDSVWLNSRKLNSQKIEFLGIVE